ncbi:hypothetical protein N9W89_08430 [Hellea sp.]|nr:hypothetical protein [Hellea sp.]
MALKTIRKTAAGIITASALWGGVAVAADESDPAPPKNDAVTSLENVLQKASEQGFVDIKGQVKASKRRNPVSPNENKVAVEDEDFGTMNCSVTSVLDLSIYKSVSSYEDISLLKSNIAEASTLEHTLPLVKTYMALGLGTEMSSSVQKFKGHKARLIESMGRVIAGNPTENDIKRVVQYSDCNAAMKLWSMFAKASQDTLDTTNEPFTLSRNEKIFLEELPAYLQKLVTLRLGIYAAEEKSETMAVRMLTSLAPETEYGKVPAVKDDAILYFYGLVSQLKGDPAASQIFKHLAQNDGLYRTRSLQKLAEDNINHGTELYDNFSEDLAAVSQQYNGQRESRQATLQVIKHRLKTDQFIDAIKQSKREFALNDAERIEAVNYAAERLTLRLQDAEKSKQIHALNSYLFDPSFFSNYDHLGELKTRAKDTAIDLNLPELVSIITPVDKKLSKDEKASLAYTNALIAQKQGDYDRVFVVSKPYKADPKFQALILEAALKSGNYKQTIDSLSHKAPDAERFALQADIAWQKGHWGEAKISLEALAHKAPDSNVANKIAITNYVGGESLAYVNRAAPKTAADLNLLKAQLDNDIALVKGYLNNG